MKRLLFIPIIFICSICYAQTISNISGTVDNGQTVTISGSGFGTKTTAAPIKFENFEDGSLELYNLREDTSETHNLSNEHPHLSKTLYDQLKKWQEQTGAQIPPVNPDWDPSNEGRW